ncbi:MAG: hypothetical protein FJ265_01825 [Planctomycetes bacterium]|nr:hypothetical protein [Planctomycetota bacterium]
MHVQRFLGSAWASVHGPSEPARWLVWMLEAKFAGFGAAPGPRAVDWGAVARAAAKLPIEVAMVRAGSVFAQRSATAGLGSAKEAERRAAAAAVQKAVALARQLGCPRIVFEPGAVAVLGEVECEDLGDGSYTWSHDRAQALLARRKAGRNVALDRACREVHGIVRAFPDVEFSLAAGRSLLSLADRASLQDLFEDLRSLRLGYWHDAAIAARREQVLGEPQGEWLQTFGNRLSGMDLGDAGPDGMYLPPGSGAVDYGLMASSLRRGGAPTPVVLELDPAVSAAELAGIRSCLDKHGL